MKKYDVIVVGCGICGAVVARELAEKGKQVLIIEKRNHIGGNMYDHYTPDGILVQDYGPHTFHTKSKRLYEYICKYGEWQEYHLKCGSVIDNLYTPTPFNFKTLDTFFTAEIAKKTKKSIKSYYGEQDSASVLELLAHENKYIRQFATFLFEKDYKLYTAKQWNTKVEDIDSSILERVPVRFNYREEYFDDEYQVMPKTSYTDFFNNILNHDMIDIECKRSITSTYPMQL